MKRKVFATLLSLATITSLISCGPTEPSAPTTSEETTPTTSEVVLVKHNVTLPTNVTGAFVTSDKAQALKDEKVTVTVVLTDSANYRLESVKLGETALEGKVDASNNNVLTYTFLMPDNDVTLAVTTAKIEIPHKAHTIAVEGENVLVHGLAKEADVGERVRFSVSVKAGYDFKSVSVVTVGEETPVEVTGTAAAGFEFAMPDADVKVVTEAIGNYYELTESAEEVEFHNSKHSTVKTIKEYTVGERTFDPKHDNYFRAGEKVQFTVNRSGDFLVENYFLNGVEILPDNYTEEEQKTANVTYSFVMPQGGAEIKASMIERVNGLKINAPGFNVKAYTIETEGEGEGATTVETPATTITPSKKVRIDIDVPEGVEYKIGTINYSAMTYADSSSFLLKETEVDYEKFEGVYRNGFKQIDENTVEFSLPYLQFVGDVTVNITKLEPLYKNIAGKYVGFEWERHKASSSTKDFTFDKFGGVDSSAPAYRGEIEEIVEEGKAYKLLQDPDGWNPKHRLAYFDGDSMMMSWKNASDASYSSYYEDVFLTVRNVEAPITVLSYVGASFDIVEFVTGEAGSYVTVATFYINSTEKKMCSNLTIEYTAGAHVNDEGAAFTVKKGTETLATVAPEAAPQA